MAPSDWLLPAIFGAQLNDRFDTTSAKRTFQLKVCRGVSSSELLEGKNIIRLSIICILCDVTNSISELPNIYGMQAS